MSIPSQDFERFTVQFVRSERRRVRLVFHLKQFSLDTHVSFWAANPCDHRSSFTGSGLPFADAVQAYENTPNKGAFAPKSATFEIELFSPGSYYTHLCSNLIQPHVVVELTQYGKKYIETIYTSESMPFRTLTYPILPRGREGPQFYDRSHLTLSRSQETILRAGGYPTSLTTPLNHWGAFIPR